MFFINAIVNLQCLPLIGSRPLEYVSRIEQTTTSSAEFKKRRAVFAPVLPLRIHQLILM
jgi:hypothetical protein